jgi:hypothetical protein
MSQHIAYNQAKMLRETEKNRWGEPMTRCPTGYNETDRCWRHLSVARGS